MGNYVQKVITIIAIIPYISKWFNLNKNKNINKKQNIKREENNEVVWGQFIKLEELNNCNREKMS